ncbi:MAG: ABC transporter substrate-binding protein [Candidatus Eiseniibacteriota bacterium]
MRQLRLGLIGAALALALATTARAESITIGASMAADDNPFYIAMLKGIEARAKELGWSVKVVSAQNDVARQINGVQDLIAAGVKGILISPIDAVATGPAYEAAHKAGIPIISVARGSASKFQTLHVAMDEVQVGRDIATWSAKKIGGKGEVAMLRGPAGAATFDNLSKGYKEVMAKYPGIKIVYEHDNKLSREEGLKLAEDAIVAHPNLKLIYGANDDVALGAIQAVKAAGKAGKIVVTGMNGVPPALKAVKAGDLAMTVELNPVLWGRLGVDTLAAYLKGQKLQQKVYIKHVLVDASNIDQKMMPPKK